MMHSFFKLPKPIATFVFNNGSTLPAMQKRGTFAAVKSKEISMNYSLKSMIKRYVNASGVLIFFAILALVMANTSLKEWYFSIWEQEVYLSIGDFNLFSHNGHAMSIMAVINDFLMAMFFLSVGLEIKREVLVGELSSMKKAMLPIIGAMGGMLVPVIIFWLTCPNDAEMLRGVAIPMATDIAFSLGVLSIFSNRVPAGLKIFLATLAVADDVGGIIVIALFYSSEMDTQFLLLALACTMLLIAGNKTKIMKKRFYLAIGIVLWFAMLNSGIHATIAGVIVAFCIPASLKKGTPYYIERIRNNINSFPVTEAAGKHNTVILSHDDIHKLKSIESAADKLISPLQALEDEFCHFINFIVIPLFAFANVGIDFSSMEPDNLVNGVGLSVMCGLLFGKFIGVLSFSWAAIRCRIVTMPKGCNWKSFAAVCMLCGIGLTVSIFIADLSYNNGSTTGMQLLNEAKLGILCGSLASAIIGCIMLNMYLPKENIKD